MDKADEPIMGSDQELLQSLCCGPAAPLSPKQVAYAAGFSEGGLYNLWNQAGRVVPARVWSACVANAKQLYADQPETLIGIVAKIAELVGICNNIGLFFASPEKHLNTPNLCQFTADLLESQAGLVRAIARIMADGKIGPDDAPYLDKYRVSTRVLITRLLNLESALARRIAPVGARP